MSTLMAEYVRMLYDAYEETFGVEPAELWETLDDRQRADLLAFLKWAQSELDRVIASRTA